MTYNHNNGQYLLSTWCVPDNVLSTLNVVLNSQNNSVLLMETMIFSEME